VNQTAQKLHEHQEIFIGRQPIFDQNLHVVAYELLYRNSYNNYAEVADGESATADVIVNAFLEIGVENLVGSAKAFINIPRGLLLSDEIYGLPAECTVLEILEDVILDDEVVSAVKKLKESGYTIALDDFIYDENKASIVELADIIKLDLIALMPDELRQQVESMRKFDVEFLAEKLEFKQEYIDCEQMGFVYYQGYYFSKPEIVSGSKIPTNRLAILQIFSKMYDENVSMDEMETLISQDVSLSYKLLKAINSASFATLHKIESIRQAITMLGLQRIRHWVSFIMFSESDNKPIELFKMSMIRAKMCEVIADANTSESKKDIAFTVGLFSCLDSIMDQSLDSLINSLPLSDEIKSAVLEYNGILGEILECVIHYENGSWDEVAVNKFGSIPLLNYYMDSLHWAGDILEGLE